MKKTILALLLLITLLLCGAACGKAKDTEETTEDPNAVLTDSNVPLDLGAQIDELGTETETAQP